MQQVIDLERLELVAKTVSEENLLELFFDIAAEKIMFMQQCILKHDNAGWKQSAHYLKGSALNLGMAQISQICKEAEQEEPSVKILEAITAAVRSTKNLLNSSGYISLKR